jgi:hypothetical protein
MTALADGVSQRGGVPPNKGLQAKASTSAALPLPAAREAGR